MLPEDVKRAIEAGLSVVPQLRGAKRPLIAWKKYQTQPVSLEVAERWARKYPDAVWALVCGPVSGYIVLDFDDLATFRRYDLKPFVKSPHGGVHVWVRQPGFDVVGGSRVDQEHFPGLDIRSVGHLATFSGKGYRIVNRKVYTLQELPDALRLLIESRKRSAEANVDVALPPEFTDYMSGNELLDEAVGKVAEGGSRNEVGFWLSCQLRDERYPFEAAWEVMRRYGRKMNMNGKHPYAKQEAYNSLMQAFNSPVRMPRALEDKNFFNRVFKQELARDTAKQTLRSMKLGTFSLEAFMGDPPEDEALMWSVEDLHPEGSNVLITGQRKVGKTTFGLNLARSLLDNKLFLGRFKVRELTGNVGYWNFEMSLRQFNVWLRGVNIKNIQGFVHWPLRGKHVDIFSDDVFHYIVEQLKKYEVEYLIVDPWARAISGLADENDNSEVARYLERLDMIKARAGIPDLVVMAHTGKQKRMEGDETARGASRLEDWADVLWFITRDGNDRYMWAEGRDVDVEEFGLMYDEEHRRFEFAEGGRKEERFEKAAQEVVKMVKRQPGVTYNELYEALNADKNARSQGIRIAKERGWIYVKTNGRKKEHYIP